MDESCKFLDDEQSPEGGDCSLMPKIFISAEQDVGSEAPMPEGKGVVRGGHLRFGRWLVTSCIR